jgi:hypothetical protein
MKEKYEAAAPASTLVKRPRTCLADDENAEWHKPKTRGAVLGFQGDTPKKEATMTPPTLASTEAKAYVSTPKSLRLKR